MTEKNDTKQLIDRLEATRNLSRDEWIRLIQNRTADDADYLFERAQAVRTRHYGRSVYIRGLIEFTNYCKTTASTAEYEKVTEMPTVTV